LNKIEENLIDSLNRINFVYKNRKIFTECVKNYNGFSLFGKRFGPFEKGKKYNLKFFIAVPFIENNILKIESSKKCDNVDVQRFAIAERDDPRLIRQENFFLNEIREFKIFLKKQIKDGEKPKSDMDRFNSYMANIIDNRLLKLLKLAKAEAEISLEDERKLTNSEHLLFNHIYNLIVTWRSFYLGKN